jgi:hypothetical protein
MEKLQRGHNLCRIELCPFNIEPAAKGNIFDKRITKKEIRLNVVLFGVLSKRDIAIKVRTSRRIIQIKKRFFTRVFHNNETLLKRKLFTQKALQKEV